MARNERSLALWEEARHIILGGVQQHKRNEELIPYGFPIFMVRGKGSRVWDADGNAYIDYLLAYGPMVLGYGHPAVDRAVQRQMKEGAIFDLAHPLEIELARKLIEVIPSAEMVSYFVGGSGATSAAVGLARAHTGRDLIVRCGYHGWHDWCRAGEQDSPETSGVPASIRAMTVAMEYNDLNSLADIFRKHPDEVAGVIMEPVMGRGPKPGYLEGVRDLAHENGAVFIMDEVKTGFRFALGGAQEYFGVTPDLTTLGKAMCNGYPGSALVGRREILEPLSEVWLAATFHGELLSIAAALTTIEALRKPAGIPHIWRQGKKLMDGLSDLFNRMGVALRIVGYPPMPTLTFPKKEGSLAKLFISEIAKRGVYFSFHPWFVSAAHSDKDMAQTLEAAEDALKAAKERI